MIPLSQRDSRWKNITLGKSSSTIGDYGCTITCLSMILGINPDVFNEKFKAVSGYDVDKVIWSRVSLAFPELKHIERSKTYNNEKVKAAIERNGFCLVEVDFDGKISSPADMHWVVYLGNQRMLDPWTGVEKATSYYPLVKGYSIFDRVAVSAPPTSPSDPIQPPTDPDKVKVVVGGDWGTMEVQAIRSTLNDQKVGLEAKSKELPAFVDKWFEEWKLSLEMDAAGNPVKSKRVVLEEEMGKYLKTEDLRDEYRNKLEELVGEFEKDDALYKAIEAFVSDKTQVVTNLETAQKEIVSLKNKISGNLAGYSAFELLSALLGKLKPRR